MSLGTRACGTRDPARSRLRGSGGSGRALRASAAAAHGSGLPSWATRGPGKSAAAAISVPAKLPPRITLPYSSAPPSALASDQPGGSGAPWSSGAFSWGCRAEFRASRPGGRAPPALARSLSSSLRTQLSSRALCGQAGAGITRRPAAPGPRTCRGTRAASRRSSSIRAAPRLARRSPAPVRPGQPRPRRSELGAHGRALQPVRAVPGAGGLRAPPTHATVILEAFAPRLDGFGGGGAAAGWCPAAAANPRRGLGSGAESAAQAGRSAARRGEDSGGDGSAEARSSRLLKGTPPAFFLPAEAEHLPLGGGAHWGTPRGRGSGAQGCGRRAGLAAVGWG